MSPRDSRPSNAELAVLDALWKQSPLTVREVANAVHGAPTPVQYRTVQVQLDRLEKKGLVTRDRSCAPQVFSPTVDRGQVIGEELKQIADKVCEGSFAPLLMNLAKGADLTEAEKAELLRLLQEDGES